MDDRPARAGELRGLRRWLLVAAVWATAATAIAVIALLAATDAREDSTEAEHQNAQTASQISVAQRRLDRRVDEIESRLDELASANDVSELGTRLERVEKADGKGEQMLEELSGSVDDLDARVEALEENPSDPAEGTGDTP